MGTILPLFGCLALGNGTCSADSKNLKQLTPSAFGWLRGKDLNLRPLGYEPNELPDCSTPHNYPSVVLRNRQSIWQFLMPAIYLAPVARAASRLRIWFITSAARNGLRRTGKSCSS